MSEIKIGFATIVGYKDFSMFERVHGSGVNIDIRVELLHGHPKSSCFQKAPKGGSRYSLTESTRNPTSNEDVFSHG